MLVHAAPFERKWLCLAEVEALCCNGHCCTIVHVLSGSNFHVDMHWQVCFVVAAAIVVCVLKSELF